MERILIETWRRARKRHLFPGLPRPRLKRLPDGALLSMAGGEILLESSFFHHRNFENGAGEVLRAALDHAICHHTLCPFDLALLAELRSEAFSILESYRAAARAVDLFVDAVVDHHLFFRLGSPIHRVYRKNRGCPLFRVLLGGLQRSLDKDLGTQDMGEVSLRLSRLPYLDKARWPVTVRRFSRIVAPFIIRGLKEPFLPPLGRHGPRNYPGDELGRSLGRLASRCQGPGAFRERIRALDAGESDGGEGGGLTGLGPGEEVQADYIYYMKLASAYNLGVRPGLFDESTQTYPSGHVPWETGEPVLRVDPFSSFGRVLPSVSQMWRTERARFPVRRLKVPDLLIMLDSSGSMPDPAATLSHAVLAAGLAADAYLRNSASVGVYNFANAMGRRRKVTGFTRSREEVFRALTLYIGGGTSVDLQEFGGLLEQGREVDVFLMTDMEIMNLEGLIDFLGGQAKRVCAVHLGEKKGALRFRKRTRGSGNISVFRVESQRDLATIVLGQAKRYLGESLAPGEG